MKLIEISRNIQTRMKIKRRTIVKSMRDENKQIHTLNFMQRNPGQISTLTVANQHSRNQFQALPSGFEVGFYPKFSCVQITQLIYYVLGIVKTNNIPNYAKCCSTYKNT